MKNLIPIAFCCTLVLGLTVAGVIGVFEPEPNTDSASLRRSLNELRKEVDEKEGAVDRASFNKLVDLTELQINLFEDTQSRWKTRLMRTYLPLAIFLGITVMAATFLGFVIYLKVSYGIRFSDSLSFQCLLNTGIAPNTPPWSIALLRSKLGVLLWYSIEGEMLCDDLAAVDKSGSLTVMTETRAVFRTLKAKLLDCRVAPVDPQEAEFTRIGKAHAEMKAAKQRFTEADQAVEQKRKEIERLKIDIHNLRLKEAEYKRVKGDSDAALLELERRLARMHEEEARLIRQRDLAAGQADRLKAVGAELNSLLLQLSAWEDLAPRAVGEILQNGSNGIPLISELVRTFAGQNGTPLPAPPGNAP